MLRRSSGRRGRRVARVRGHVCGGRRGTGGGRRTAVLYLEPRDGRAWKAPCHASHAGVQDRRRSDGVARARGPNGTTRRAARPLLAAPKNRWPEKVNRAHRLETGNRRPSSPSHVTGAITPQAGCAAAGDAGGRAHGSQGSSFPELLWTCGREAISFQASCCAGQIDQSAQVKDMKSGTRDSQLCQPRSAVIRGHAVRPRGLERGVSSNDVSDRRPRSPPVLRRKSEQFGKSLQQLGNSF